MLSPPRVTSTIRQQPHLLWSCLAYRKKPHLSPPDKISKIPLTIFLTFVWGVYVQNFSSIALKLSEEFEVTDRHRGQTTSPPASLMFRRRNEGGERNGNGRRCECWTKISLKTFPVKKRINTELFIDGKQKLYIQKWRRDRIEKISDLSEGGRILVGNKSSGCENSSRLFRWTYYYWEEKLNNGRLFETTLNLWSEKYRSTKKRVNERVLWYLYQSKNLNISAHLRKITLWLCNQHLYKKSLVTADCYYPDWGSIIDILHSRVEKLLAWPGLKSTPLDLGSQSGAYDLSATDFAAAVRVKRGLQGPFQLGQYLVTKGWK